MTTAKNSSVVGKAYRGHLKWSLSFAATVRLLLPSQCPCLLQQQLHDRVHKPGIVELLCILSVTQGNIVSAVSKTEGLRVFRRTDSPVSAGLLYLHGSALKNAAVSWDGVTRLNRNNIAYNKLG